jgi:hypothetical protein
MDGTYKMGNIMKLFLKTTVRTKWKAKRSAV